MLWQGAFMQYIIEKWLYTFVLYIVTSVVFHSQLTPHTTGSCPESTDQTPADLLPAVIALSAVQFAVILVLAVAIFTIVLLCTSESDVIIHSCKSACMCKCMTLWCARQRLHFKAACRYKGPLWQCCRTPYKIFLVCIYYNNLWVQHWNSLIVYSMQYIHCQMSIYHFFPHCVYIGIQKLFSVVMAMKGSNYHAEVEMGSHKLPKSHSKSTTEPQYEEGGGGVSSSNFTIEESPAYQSVDVAVAQLWTV